jgi:hypothetical protein
MYRALMNSVIDDVNIKPNPATPEQMQLVRDGLISLGITEKVIGDYSHYRK